MGKKHGQEKAVDSKGNEKINFVLILRTIKRTFTRSQMRLYFHRWGQANLELQLTLTYTGPIPISMEKKKDLLELLPFISPLFHEFYKNLRAMDDVHNVLPVYSMMRVIKSHY
ncbi:hypothetical protein PR048_001624 [Dryococelus australis]|uniref:Uncharacterized protein n=1 Tax=Dryococelus australis TaxID=614101 RepID=A0ABQ9IHV1_9NEOP|nr:hypothetical protein PR048_001624 [Dryococelus australis]